MTDEPTPALDPDEDLPDEDESVDPDQEPTPETQPPQEPDQQPDVQPDVEPEGPIEPDQPQPTDPSDFRSP